MAFSFDSFYQSLGSDAKHIYHVLALCHYPIRMYDLLDIVVIKQKISEKRLKEVLKHGLDRQYIKSSYYNEYHTEGHIKVWLYPLIEGYKIDRSLVSERVVSLRFYFESNFKILLSYLDALWYNPNQLKTCEDDLFRSSINLSSLMAILYQPRYEEIYPRISPKIIEYIYCKIGCAGTV